MSGSRNMTSTSFNIGLTADSKLTSRVLKPPGGGHTDIFGHCEPEAPRGRKPAPPAPASLGGDNNVEKPTNGTEAKTMDANQNKTQPPRNDKEPAPAADGRKPAPVQDNARSEPAKRVRVPPGGFSSGLW